MPGCPGLALLQRCPQPRRPEGSAGRAARGRGPCTSTFWGVGVGARQHSRWGSVGPQTAALPACSPSLRLQGAPRLRSGHAHPEEGGGRAAAATMWWVVLTTVSLIPGSSGPRPLASPPPAGHSEGRAPLFGLGKKGGKVILRCLRRWVIGPQGLARTRAQCRLPPVGGGSGQRLAEMPRVVNKLQVPVPPARGPFCVRSGREVGGRRDGDGEASGRGRQAGGRRGRQSLF